MVFTQVEDTVSIRSRESTDSQRSLSLDKNDCVLQLVVFEQLSTLLMEGLGPQGTTCIVIERQLGLRCPMERCSC